MHIEGSITYSPNHTPALTVRNMRAVVDVPFGQAEVDEIYFPILLAGGEEVFWFDIAVDVSLRMHVFYSFEGLVPVH